MKDELGFVRIEHYVIYAAKCTHYMKVYNAFDKKWHHAYLYSNGVLHQEDEDSPKYYWPGEGGDQKGLEGVMPLKYHAVIVWWYIEVDGHDIVMIKY